MCWHPKAVCCPEPQTERQKLSAAIERLEKHKWCDDAMIALEAARKHLATLPNDPLYRVYQCGVAAMPPFYDARDRAAAQAWAKDLLAIGADSVRIEPR